MTPFEPTAGAEQKRTFYWCGRCGGPVTHDDEHQRAHLYGLPGPMGAFVLVLNGRPSLGAATGFNPLASAKYVPLEEYDAALSETLAKFVKTQSPEAKDGFYPLPEDITPFAGIAPALFSLVMKHFPNHILCHECSLPAGECECPDEEDEDKSEHFDTAENDVPSGKSSTVLLDDNNCRLLKDAVRDALPFSLERPLLENLMRTVDSRLASAETEEREGKLFRRCTFSLQECSLISSALALASARWEQEGSAESRREAVYMAIFFKAHALGGGNA